MSILFDHGIPPPNTKKAKEQNPTDLNASINHYVNDLDNALTIQNNIGAQQVQASPTINSSKICQNNNNKIPNKKQPEAIKSNKKQ